MGTIPSHEQSSLYQRKSTSTPRSTRARIGAAHCRPFAAKTLADFGADVVKVETPKTGDPLRKWRLLKDGTSVWWQVQSRNKRSVALDLKENEAQDIVRQLVKDTDVLIENFRPGAMEGWGLGLTNCWPSTRVSSCCASAAMDKQDHTATSPALVWWPRP